MTCQYCNGTGKYKKPNDKEKFDSFVELEMDKAYFVSYEMAIKKAYDKIGYEEIDCPHCSNVEK